VLLLPLKGKEEGADVYMQYKRGNFDLSRDGNAE
jgi:hypothetical protein